MVNYLLILDVLLLLVVIVCSRSSPRFVLCAAMSAWAFGELNFITQIVVLLTRPHTHTGTHTHGPAQHIT